MNHSERNILSKSRIQFLTLPILEVLIKKNLFIHDPIPKTPLYHRQAEKSPVFLEKYLQKMTFCRIAIYLFFNKKIKIVYLLLFILGIFDINNCSTIQQDINEYAFEGNLTGLKSGLTKIKSINFQDDRGWTPLMAAVENNKKEIVTYLLNEGVYIDIRNDSGDTALMRAVYMGHPNMITLLLDRGANRGIRAKNGYTPFQKACEKGNLEIAKLLYRENIDIKDRVFDSMKYSLFHLSVKKEDPELMEWLLQKGADINAKAEDGRTPIMIALLEKKKKAITFLLSKGANLNDTSYYGETISQLARQSLDPEIVNLISATQPSIKNIIPFKK